MAKYDDTRNPLSPNYRQSPPGETRVPAPYEELLGALFGGLFAGVISLAIGGFFLLVAYGVVLLIFRNAFGVELPNPFDWLGLSWFRK